MTPQSVPTATQWACGGGHEGKPEDVSQPEFSTQPKNNYSTAVVRYQEVRFITPSGDDGFAAILVGIYLFGGEKWNAW